MNFGLSEAIELAVIAHRGQSDKANVPYIMHPLHVLMELKKRGYNESFLIVGVLHDIVEDTEVTLKELEDRGVSNEVYHAVKAMTHEKGVSYEDYIEEIAQNSIARAVKLEDLRHNMDITRRVGTAWSPKTAKRMEKYFKAYDRLVGGALGV